jgi:hypothetical protein
MKKLEDNKRLQDLIRLTQVSFSQAKLLSMLAQAAEVNNDGLPNLERQKCYRLNCHTLSMA